MIPFVVVNDKRFSQTRRLCGEWCCGGVDAIVHAGAGEDNTIAVVANGLDIRYPAVNKNLIQSIESKGLLLSQFNVGFRATGCRPK